MNSTNNTGNSTHSYVGLCSIPAETEYVIMAVYLIVVLVLTVAGNVLVISVVVAYQRLQQVTNYFIVSLAVSDLLIAALTLPFTIYQNLHNGIWCLNLATCGVWLVVDSLVSTSAIWSLVAISIDRLIAITMPFRYQEIVTRKRAFLALGVVWAFSFVVGPMTLLNWTDPDLPGIASAVNGHPIPCQRTEPIYYTFAAAIAFFVPLLIILTAYSFILKVAITQAKAVAALDPTRDRRKKTNFFREVKATKTVALVIGAFVISWLPLFVLLMLALWDREVKENFEVNHPGLHKFTFFTFTRVLPPLNSCVNPIIYAVFNSNFRSAFLKFLRCPQRMQHDRHDRDRGNNQSMTATTSRSSYSTVTPDKPTSGNNNTET